MNKKILLFGATSQVGLLLTKLVVINHYNVNIYVRNVDKFNKQINDENITNKINKIYIGDFTELDKIKDTLNDCNPDFIYVAGCGKIESIFSSMFSGYKYPKTLMTNLMKVVLNNAKEDTKIIYQSGPGKYLDAKGDPTPPLWVRLTKYPVGKLMGVYGMFEDNQSVQKLIESDLGNKFRIVVPRVPRIENGEASKDKKLISSLTRYAMIINSSNDVAIYMYNLLKDESQNGKAPFLVYEKKQ